jgi:hypothetical protein
MWIFWHEVYAAFMPGVAFQDSSRAQLNTADQAVFLDGFLSVVRTTGVEAALAANQQAQGELVDGNQLDGDSVQHLSGLARRGSSGFLDQVPPELFDLESKVFIAQGADSAAG